MELPPFPSLNKAYNSVFQAGKLSVGVIMPLEAYTTSPVPSMERHVEKAQLADALGFKALWIRDVPFNVPTFGDAGQTFDPYVYLGFLAAHTKNIALVTGSLILPLRHPAHVAKAAASVDQLSGGRFLMGIASGDRPEEYPAMNVDFERRGESFADAYDYIRKMADAFARFSNPHGNPAYMDMLPKPTAGRIPMLITGGSRQPPDWVASHGDGCITYPRSAPQQARVIADYRARSVAGGSTPKPVSQSLYIDLIEDDNAHPSPIHLGFRSGSSYLIDYLKALRQIGVNHVALNLRFNEADIEDTMKRLAAEVLPALED